MTICNNIKELRRALNMTQQEFADRLGIRRGTVASYETGNLPSARTISDICRIFGVDELWLRTGEGEMFRAVTREEEIAAFFAGVLNGESHASFKRTLIYALSKLDEDAWIALENLLRSMIDAQKETDR